MLNIYQYIMFCMPEEILKIIEIKTRDRIVIPKEVREKLNIRTGDHIIFTIDDGGGIRLRKAVIKMGDEHGQ